MRRLTDTVLPGRLSSPNILSQPVTAWTPPTYLDWDGIAPTQLIAIAGRLHEPGGVDALLARFAAVSRLKGVRYWSITEQSWQTLSVTDAAGTNRRDDFRPEELQPAVPLYSVERNGRSSGVVIYGMRVIAGTADRVAMNVVNASSVRASVVTLFEPGELQTTFSSNVQVRTSGVISVPSGLAPT
jgi:hypothetical protein